MNKSFFVKNIAAIIPLITAIILLIIMFVIAYLSLRSTNDGQQQSLQKDITPNTQGDITTTPDTDTQFDTGKRQLITIYFTHPIVLSETTITLSALPETEKEPKPTKIDVFQIDEKTIFIKTVDVITPYTEYRLAIKNNRTNSVIFKNRYFSIEPKPTKIPQNNVELKQFLPYETDTFSLEYDSEKNLYLFHFIYNPDLSGTLEELFEQAKAEATRYIESKGVDISSIVIEWKRY